MLKDIQPDELPPIAEWPCHGAESARHLRAAEVHLRLALHHLRQVAVSEYLPEPLPGAALLHTFHKARGQIVRLCEGGAIPAGHSAPSRLVGPVS